MSYLAAVTVDCILDPLVPLWWPGLAGHLVDDLRRQRGLNLATYSTTAWVTQGSESPQHLFAVQSTHRIDVQSVVEVLPPSVQRRYATSGCRFWGVDELARGAPLRLLACALDEIAAVPELAYTVGQLARRIHLLLPNDDAYDVNFSEPELPLSVFVSMPLRPREHLRWRVAEAIVHEVGHLQLSLVERIVPLIASPQAQHYSPWRHAARSVSGVLHGLYVFGVIAEWISQSSAPTAHVRQRLAEIALEAGQIHDFPEARGLTHTGAVLARSILARVSAAASSPVSAVSDNEETLQETR